jgi:hypothetical protein
MFSQTEEESDGEHETILDLVKRPKLFIRNCVALQKYSLLLSFSYIILFFIFRKLCRFSGKISRSVLVSLNS